MNLPSIHLGHQTILPQMRRPWLRIRTSITQSHRPMKSRNRHRNPRTMHPRQSPHIHLTSSNTRPSIARRNHRITTNLGLLRTKHRHPHKRRILLIPHRVHRHRVHRDHILGMFNNNPRITDPMLNQIRTDDRLRTNQHKRVLLINQRKRIDTPMQHRIRCMIPTHDIDPDSNRHGIPLFQNPIRR